VSSEVVIYLNCHSVGMPGSEINVVRSVFPSHLKGSRLIFIALWLDV